MSKEKSPKEVSGLLQLACAVHAMDPRTRHLLQDAARLLDDYAALLARHNALRDAVAWERECQGFTYRRPMSIDAMKELLLTRYAAIDDVDQLLGES